MSLLPKEKKIKGQIPYELYTWVMRMANNRRIPIHDVIAVIVRDAAKCRRIYTRELVDWGRNAKGCPNNVHFYADDVLLERFENLKKLNRIGGDSGAIRIVLKAAYGDLKRSPDGSVQEQLF